ncbi:MAG TPA: OmpW family outer membrane protein [Thermoanaerobaculia bacterium]|nr:OmpW family outer membrane protein [Thermoanaerobaculia bacterium]
MRKLFIVLLAVAPAAFAQQKNEFSIFISNPGYTSFQNQSWWEGGVGMSFDKMVSPHVSAQLSIAEERYHFVATNARTYPETVLPIDFIGRYHFATESRWRPYLGFGVRYVAAPFGYASRLNPEINGGVVFQVRRSLGIFVDAKQVLGMQSGPVYDPLTKTALGLSWRW